MTDIVEQYHNGRVAPVPTQMLKDAIDEVVRLREENEKLRHAIKRYTDQHIYIHNELIRDTMMKVEL